MGEDTRKLIVVRLAVVGAGNGAAIILGVTGHEGEMEMDSRRKPVADRVVFGATWSSEWMSMMAGKEWDKTYPERSGAL